ncbi:DUF6415 family natural product biosynthesis protein [Streptomyces sp. KR55]|uniref:DUF6415 family natural product biosynthesis protein n=1 Tax=Streptomyces sp. KR55 TaxID=3457425 RepID=UPI003FD613EF
MSTPVAVEKRAPADEDTLTTLLAAMQAWTPFDGDALLDDVGTVLDDVMPREEDAEELAERLRGHLMRLVDIAVANEAGEDDQAAELIGRAREVRAEEMPGDYWQAIGHLRRMAWTVNELLERLVAIKCLKEAA